MRNLQGGGRWLEPSIAHLEKAIFCRQNTAQESAGERIPAFSVQPCCNPVAWGVCEGSGDMVLHVEEDVKVGLEGDADGAVAKEFLK